MPTLTTPDGRRCCPKCKAVRNGKKQRIWPLLLCRVCIIFEADRDRFEQKMEARVALGMDPVGNKHGKAARYRRTPRPKLTGAATLKREDLPPSAREFLEKVNFSVEDLEALSQPWGHAVYEEELKAEREGRSFSQAPAAPFDGARIVDGDLDKKSYSKSYSGSTRRDSAIDVSARGSASSHRDYTRAYKSGQQVSAPSAHDLWHLAKFRPCQFCICKKRSIDPDHALADCRYVSVMMEEVVVFRLREAGYELGAGGTVNDRGKKTKKDTKAVGSTGGGNLPDGKYVLAEKRRKACEGPDPPTVRSSVETPCWNCDKTGFELASSHCLLACKYIRDKPLEKEVKRIVKAFAFVDELLGKTRVGWQREESEKVSGQIAGEEMLEMAQDHSTAESEDHGHSSDESEVSIANTTSVAGWRSQALDEILRMEMTARPGSWLEVARAVRKELEVRLMVDVMTGDPQEGMPVSIPLLEELLPRIEFLEQITV